MLPVASKKTEYVAKVYLIAIFQNNVCHENTEDD